MRGKPVFWIVVALLVVPAAGMAWFAWDMVARVRADAATTDARLRELAWSVLAYADAHDAFPASEAALREFVASGAVRDALAKPPVDPAVRSYPASRAAAGLVGAPVPLDDCLESIEVEWPPAADVQPILRSKGKPTLQGTLPAVGDWLYAASERIRGA